MCVNESGQHEFRKWLVAYSAPSHYLNQCWVIVNWTLRDKLPRNFKQNTQIFFQFTITQHWFRKWLVAYSVPSHYLNHCFFNWTIRNKRQWNFNKKKRFFHENASENIVCEMAATLSKTETKWPPCLRRHFQMHFPEWKRLNLAKELTEICS